MFMKRQQGIVPRIRYPLRWVAFATLTVGCGLSLPAQAQWSAGKGLTTQGLSDNSSEFTLNDSVSRTEQGVDIREDRSIGSYNFQLADYTAVSFLGAMQRTQFEGHSGLSTTELNVTIAVRHKFGLGDTVPELVMNLDTGRDSINSENRDALRYTASLALQKRFTPRLSLSAGVGWTERNGAFNGARIGSNNGQPSDPLNYWHASFGGELELGTASWLSASYQIQQGDVAVAGAAYPGLFNSRIQALATALARDPLFGNGIVAYRALAPNGSLTVDFNHAVRDTGTLFLGVEYQGAQRKSDDVERDVGIVRAGLMYSF